MVLGVVTDPGAGVVGEDTLVVLEQSEPGFELVTEDVAEEDDGYKPEVSSAVEPGTATWAVTVP